MGERRTVDPGDRLDLPADQQEAYKEAIDSAYGGLEAGTWVAALGVVRSLTVNRWRITSPNGRAVLSGDSVFRAAVSVVHEALSTTTHHAAVVAVNGLLAAGWTLVAPDGTVLRAERVHPSPDCPSNRS